MADINKSILLEPCHISKAASITKMFVGTLTHLLVEDGVLNLDDPISKWLTDKQLKDIKMQKKLPSELALVIPPESQM